MKNHRTHWEPVKEHGKQLRQHSKRIVTNTLLAGVLILSGNAVEANPLAVADFNGDEYSDLSVSAPNEQVSLAMLSQVNAASVNRSMSQTKAAKAAVQLFSDMSTYSLQTNAYAPTFLFQHTLHSTNKYESGFAVNDDGSWVMFSW